MPFAHYDEHEAEPGQGHENHIDWPVPERTPSKPGTSYHPAAAAPEYERWKLRRILEA